MKLLLITLLATLSFGIFATDTVHSTSPQSVESGADQHTAQLMEESFNHLRTLYVVYYTTGQDYEKYGEQSYAFRDAAIVMNNFFIDPALIDLYVEKIKSGELADTQEFSANALLRGVILAVFDWKF